MRNILCTYKGSTRCKQWECETTSSCTSRSRVTGIFDWQFRRGATILRRDMLCSERLEKNKVKLGCFNSHETICTDVDRFPYGETGFVRDQ